jgi:hypothetical protein
MDHGIQAVGGLEILVCEVATHQIRWRRCRRWCAGRGRGRRWWRTITLDRGQEELDMEESAVRHTWDATVKNLTVWMERRQGRLGTYAVAQGLVLHGQLGSPSRRSTSAPVTFFRWCKEACLQPGCRKNFPPKCTSLLFSPQNALLCWS